MAHLHLATEHAWLALRYQRSVIHVKPGILHSCQLTVGDRRDTTQHPNRAMFNHSRPGNDNITRVQKTSMRKTRVPMPNNTSIQHGLPMGPYLHSYCGAADGL